MADGWKHDKPLAVPTAARAEAGVVDGMNVLKHLPQEMVENAHVIDIYDDGSQQAEWQKGQWYIEVEQRTYYRLFAECDGFRIRRDYLDDKQAALELARLWEEA